MRVRIGHVGRRSIRRESANIDAPYAVHYTRCPAAAWRRSQVVRQRSAKPLFAGSIPAVASIFTPPGFNFASRRWYRTAGTACRRPAGRNGSSSFAARKSSAGVPSISRSRREGCIAGPWRGDSRELRAKIGRTFQLDLDLTDFHARARGSAAHEWVADAGFGRLLCGSTLFEDVVKIITTTNTTWRQTVRMNELLVEKCGLRTRSGAHAFPRPEDRTRATRSCGCARRRASR